MLRRPRPILALALLTLLLAAPVHAGILGDGTCIVGNRPAATLLFPYFEVDLARPSHTTLIAITNTHVNRVKPSAARHIVRVVLWTDYGIPTLAFDLFLDSQDTQTLNLSDVFRGFIPHTGSGRLEGINRCADQVTRPGGVMDLPAATLLRARHTGAPDPGTDLCAGRDHGDTIARGYITVDVTDQCMPPSVVGVGSPAIEDDHPLAYFGGDSNVLTGDYFFVDNDGFQAEGNAAVPIIADSDRFTNDGTLTFYGRYRLSAGGAPLGAIDRRTPLSSEYQTRYLNGGLFDGGTSLVVWREVPRTEPRRCATTPAWYPLAQQGVTAVDEDGTTVPVHGALSSPFPLATQKVPVAELGGAALPGDFGALRLALGMPQRNLQAWVVSILSADVRFSLGFDATRLNDLCGVAP